MGSNDLTILDNNLKLLAYPEKQLDAILATQFKFWLSNLLQIKADKEQSMDGAIQAIKKKFWSLGLSDIKKAFEMYALGELEIKPISNHIDIILVGQIFNDYKKQQRTQKPTKSTEEIERLYKSEQDYIHVVSIYDHYISTGILSEESFWIYSYLVDSKKVIEFEEELRVSLFNKYYENYPKKEAIIKSKIELLEQYFTKLNEKGTHIKHLIK